MTDKATGQCVGRTRDGRPCTMRATTAVHTPGREVLYVCGTHRIAHEETAVEHGNEAATARVLTGRRP